MGFLKTYNILHDYVLLVQFPLNDKENADSFNVDNLKLKFLKLIVCHRWPLHFIGSGF